MEATIISAGFGGQGVLLIGQLIAYAGLHEGKNVSWLPAYGPEMRGGTANCTVVVSDEEVGSPYIAQPQMAIIMNKPSLATFEPNIQPGGLLFYNASLIDPGPARTDLEIFAVPANDIAQELGNPRVANMVMLGAFLQRTKLCTQESVVASLRANWGPSKEKLIPVNQQALARGAACVTG